MTVGGHNAAIVMALKPPMAYGGMPQVVKGESFNPGPPTGRARGFFLPQHY